MSLPGRLREDLDRVCRVRELVVATDFDGVLASFTDDPMDARPQPGTLADLREIGGLPRTTGVLVSGRDLRTLSALTDGPDDGLVRLGSHGAESSRSADSLLTERTEALLARVAEDVEAALRRLDLPARVEHKPTAVVLHTRGLPEREARAVSAIADEVARLDGVRLLHGKHVHELAVVEADKGTALRALVTDLSADAFVYLGDDVTDEHAFEVAGPDDVTVKVGSGETAARHRVEHVEDVPEVLALVRRLRHGG